MKLIALLLLLMPLQQEKPPAFQISDQPTSFNIVAGEPPNIILRVSNWNPLQGGMTKDSIISVDTKKGRIDRLSDTEYSELQKRRAALEEEETAIAKAHNVYFYVDPCAGQTSCAVYPIGGMTTRYSDQWEIRGQFLLVNVPPRNP